MSDLSDKADVYITEDGEWVPIGQVSKVNIEVEHSRREFVGYTPNDELRELVKQWRSEAEYMEENSEEYAYPKVTEMAAAAIKDCADELEGLLDE